MKSLAPLSIALLACLTLGSAASNDTSLATVLQRAGVAVERYSRETAVILANETCQQRAYRARRENRFVGGFSATTVARRRWKADLALLPTPAFAPSGYPWVEFRDVVEVDGRALPDRQSRIEGVLQSASGMTIEKARAFTQESSRFNIGPVARNINTPSVVLLVVAPVNQQRFVFEKTGEEAFEGIPCWKLGYHEWRAPTLIRLPENIDAPASGALLVDPSSGEVLRGLLELTTSAESSGTTTVTFRHVKGFEGRLPIEMVEKATAAGGMEWVEARYEYSNFRRFETGARMIVPK
jgi:hypothetical protein